jgi:hypothetical protein
MDVELFNPELRLCRRSLEKGDVVALIVQPAAASLATQVKAWLNRSKITASSAISELLR